MFINSLKHPYKFEVSPNEEEDIDRLLFDLIETKVECALDNAYAEDIKGKVDCSLDYYKSVLYYFILMEYIQIIKRYANSIGLENNDCITDDIKEKFKLDCVMSNLPCLGKKYKQNYLDFLIKGIEIAGISFDTVKCTECCVGLGEMIEEGINECTAFIIGPCVDPDEVVPEIGNEFTIDEFINDERT